MRALVLGVPGIGEWLLLGSTVISGRAPERLSPVRAQALQGFEQQREPWSLGSSKLNYL